MELGLAGKVALVAASSTGLGRAVAEEIAAEGGQLLLCARGAEQLERTATAIRSRGATVEAVTADLATEAGVRAVVDRALSRYGRVDILVTNAGGPPAGPFEGHTLDAWRTAVRV